MTYYVSSGTLNPTHSLTPRVQGSAVGPYALITYVNDYKTLGHSNYIVKYADDFTVLVPDNSDVCASNKMAHLLLWSGRNKLKINLSKCKELVLNRPKWHFPMSPDVAWANRVKLFGVYYAARHFVGGLRLSIFFFYPLFLSSFFVNYPRSWRNGTQPKPTTCDLKMYVENLGYTFPWKRLKIGAPTTFFRRLQNLTATSTIYIYLNETRYT